jgi:16S rRNA (cytosine967-C5)-methyltransferase
MVQHNSRQVACQALLRAEKPGDFLEHRLDADPGYRSLSPEDRRLARELASGVLRQRAALDWLIAGRTGGRTQRTEIQAVLRLGAYQLFFLDRIPDHAAVHESVELARSIGFGAQSGFVNAVLRALTREKAPLREALEALRLKDPATGWSHPKWLVDRWAKTLSPEDLQSLLRWNNTPPRTFARVNRLRTSPADLLARWTSEGVTVVPFDVTWAPSGTLFELESHPPLEGLPSFLEGGFYVQDPSTLLAVEALSVEPGLRVLDLCAAPGGKSFRIGGATDWRDIFGADAERVIKQRGRWQSDIAFLYQRALAETHLRGSAAVADADHADLESLCLGWVQPATFR